MVMSIIEKSSTRISRKRMSVREIIILKRKKVECSNDIDHFDSCEAALNFFATTFHGSSFSNFIRPFILQHLLYSVIRNHTIVDKELEDLRRERRVRFIKMGGEAGEMTGIMWTEDFKETVTEYCGGKLDPQLMTTFLDFAVRVTPALSIDSEMIKDFFSDEDVTALVQSGLLTVRDMGSWWISVPFAGSFIKAYKKGKRALTLMFKKTRFKEILMSELEKRSFPPGAKLGLQYHIHDLVGFGLVSRVTTTSGLLLRANASCFDS